MDGVTKNFLAQAVAAKATMEKMAQLLRERGFKQLGDSFYMEVPKMNEGQSVVQPWLSALSFKMQTVALCALRGCDGKTKEDVSKYLVRALRQELLLNADASTTFMNASCETILHMIDQLVGDLDHYPMHWLMHFTHAAEIVAYCHPEAATRVTWALAYTRIVNALHLSPESLEDMKWRLRDDPTEPGRAYVAQAEDLLRCTHIFDEDRICLKCGHQGSDGF